MRAATSFSQLLLSAQVAILDLSNLPDQINYNPKDNEKTFPILAKIARRFLSPSATTQPSEQLFSVARDVFDYRRSNLSPGNTEVSICLSGDDWCCLGVNKVDL